MAGRQSDIGQKYEIINNPFFSMTMIFQGFCCKLKIRVFKDFFNHSATNYFPFT